MDSTLSTVLMLGTGGGNTGYTFLLLGFATSGDEPVGVVALQLTTLGA